MSKQKRNYSAIKPQSSVRKLLVPQSICDVVVPFHNGFGFFKATLDAIPGALGKYYQKSTITLVDDQSDVTKLMAFTPEIHSRFGMIHTKKRLGYPGSCNLGINKGKSKYIVIITSDVVMQPGSVEILIDDMEADETIGITGPKLLFPEASSDPARPAGRIQHAGMEMGITSNIYHIFSGWKVDHPKANIKRESLSLTGAMLVIRRTDWDRAGGFFLGYGKGTWEDVDLCFSIHYLGQKVIYEPKAVGHHYVGATVLEEKEGFDLKGNEALFRLRWSQAMVWSDWAVL
jgi:GT2 family glycosyltransferase